MNAELRAAAEFILREQHDACDHIWNAHQQCQWCHRMRRDVHADELASAYLRDHAADDAEPVTKEWLREECRFYGDADITHRWVTNSFRLYFVDRINGGSVMYTGGARHYFTRGDVRRLCRALGIELKEPTT